MTDSLDILLTADILVTIEMTFTAPIRINYPPYFEVDFEDVSVEAGETLLYYFPDLDDINADDILTPTLSMFLGTIPDFFLYDEDLTYM